MKAIQTSPDGTTEGLHIDEVKEPATGDHQVKIAVKAAGINRADTLQRVGKYPPPPGTSDIMGLEVAGEVTETGAGVEKFKIGDRVMALLAGGGYAEYAIADQGSVLHIPEQMDFINAAAIPEVFLTAYQSLFLLGNLKRNEVVLIHAGASGVGTAAIQLAREAGAKIIVTAGTDEKISFCKNLGADVAINYRMESQFDRLVKQYTENKGANLIIDFIGAEYVSRNMNAASMDGQIVLLAFMSGAIAQEVNLGQLLSKRITLRGSTLRARTKEYKADLTHRFQNDFFHLFSQQKLRPIIDSVCPWEKVGKAHEKIEQNLTIGKVILKVG